MEAAYVFIDSQMDKEDVVCMYVYTHTHTHTHTHIGFPDSSVGKETACNAGDHGSIPGSRRSPGESLEKGKATHSSILAWRIPWAV